MDDTLSEFITKTSCEPGFARDLLNHHNWNLALALKSYYHMKDIIVDNGVNHFHCDDNEEAKSYTVLEIKDVNLVTNKFSSEPSLSSQSSMCETSIISSPSKLAFNLEHNLNEDIVFGDKKLTRGISRAADNVKLVSKARSEFAQDFKTSSRGSQLLNIDKFVETPDFTFTLPDISVHDEEFCEFLRKDLIEKSTLTALKSSKRLNWWSNICHDLFPLVTSGDGNCLLHAASLGMWGFHDRGLILRRALHILLSNSLYTNAFYRRWRWQTHFQNSKTGLVFSEIEWQHEWQNVLRIASTEPRSKNYDSSFDINGGKKEPNEYEEKSYIYESLEEIHIFVLAHVLRRPIIVIADTMLKDVKGEAFFPIPFGGIYLPLECSDECLMKSPLCLTYDTAHFSALVAMNSQNGSNDLPLAIPLMDVDHNILPLHFAIDPGEELFANQNMSLDNLIDNLAKTFVLTEQDKIELLKKYFDIITLAHLKDNCMKNESAVVKVEKSQTLPSNFGRKPDFSDVQMTETEKSKTLTRKSSARQILQKPFVSFGRMSKRIKKNIGHLARRSTSFRLVKSFNISNTQTNGTSPDPKAISVTATKIDSNGLVINTDNSVFYCDTYVLAAKLYTNKRHLYYDDMIKNYLNTARVRFLKEKQDKKLNQIPSSSTLSSSISSISSSLSEASSSKTSDNKSQIICVNVDCSSPASASTNYLCSPCFEEQKQTLIKKNYSSNVVVNTETKHSNKTNEVVEQLEPTKNTIEYNNITSTKTTEKLNGDNLSHLKMLPEISISDPSAHNFCITNS